MDLVARVPYDQGKSYDFYKDYLSCPIGEIRYDDIEGFGFLLTHMTRSIYLIPVFNSTSFNFNIKLNDGKKSFGRYKSSPFLFRGEKHKEIELIYSETVKCFDALISPVILKRWATRFKQGEEIRVGQLTISRKGVYKKTVFGKVKKLEKYGGCKVSQGRVTILDGNGKTFISLALADINVPIIPEFLSVLYKV